MKSYVAKLQRMTGCGSAIGFCLVLSAIVCGSAMAGGLYLNEFGTPSMGTAGAGSQAWAYDASTSFHNPAGMTRLEGKQLMVTGGLVYTDIRFDTSPDTPVPGNDGGQAGGLVPMGGAFYTHSLSDNWRFGVNLYSISAAVLDYNDIWAGRYQCQDVSIFTLTVNPSIAYKVNEYISLAGGVAFMYGSLDMDVAAPLPRRDGQVNIDGTDSQFGFNLGAMFEVREGTRLGLIYFSGMDLDFSGDVTLNPLDLQAGIDTEVVLPDMIRAGIYHELNDRWALLGTVGWEAWGQFDNQLISVERGSTVIPRNFDDTWHVAGGVHYQLNKQWLLMGGIAYDSSPTDAQDRAADMPLDRQIRYAVGAQYQYSDRLDIGCSLVYADYGSGDIDSSTLKGDYSDNGIFFTGINFNWKF